MPDYLTADELQRELPFSATAFRLNDEEYEALLADAIEQEAQRIEQWAGTRFSLDSETVTLNGSDAKRNRYDLVLPNTPIHSVASVTVDGEALDAEEYHVADTHLEHLDDWGWPRGRRNIVVEYEHGYEEMPAPIKEGLIRLVRSRLEQRKTDGLDSESGGDTSYTYRPSREIRAEVQATVRQYSTSQYRIGGAMI